MLFSREIAQAATGMAPGLTGLVGGRPAVWPKIRLFSCLVPKEMVQVSFSLGGKPQDTPQQESRLVTVTTDGALPRADRLSGESDHNADLETDTVVPLIQLAWARSGDKGDHANIGVIARKPAYLPYLRAALTESSVAEWMQHVLDPERGEVLRWDLPGIHALNFLLKHSLGGGGVASLRVDPQGKAYAQQLLDIPVAIRRSLLDS